MNVVVDDQGEPLLMDFGCSSFVNESGRAISPPSDQLRGTPRHMAPEKMLPGSYPITLQSDIWSFAMLCIEVGLFFLLAFYVELIYYPGLYKSMPV